MHGTYFGAARAVYALRLRFSVDIFFGEEQQTRAALRRADTHRRLREAHHRTARYDFHVFFDQRFVGVEYVVYILIGNAVPDPEVSLLCNSAAGYRHRPFIARLAVFYGAARRIGRVHVGNNHSYVGGKSPARYNSSRNGIYQLFFCSLRIFHLTGRNLYFGRTLGNQFSDCFRFVFFDAYIRVFGAERLFQKQNAVYEILRFFNKKSIIAGNIRLAFGGVYYQRVDVFLRRKFYVSRKSSSSHSYNTGFLYSVNYFFGRRIFKHGK